MKKNLFYLFALICSMSLFTAGVLMMKFLLKKDGIFMKSLFWNVALRLLSPPWNVK